MVNFINFTDGMVWETLAEIEWEEYGISYKQGDITYRIPWSSIKFVQVGIKKR